MTEILHPLAIHAQGPAVANLHTALHATVQQGVVHGSDGTAAKKALAALAPEQAKQQYGKATAALLEAFQRAHHLDPTGAVDEATAAVLNALLGKWGLLEGPGVAPPALPKVRGTLRRADGAPVLRATVKAFDHGLRTDAFLGEATTGADGRYEITYHPAALRPERKTGANLLLRAYGPKGKEIAHSTVLCPAPADATVDLVVGNVALRGPAEYTRVTEAVRPYLGDAPLAELTRDDVHLLACSTGLEPVQVATLVVAARLANALDLPQWLLYALGRQDVDLQVATLLARSEAEVKAMVDRAISTNVIGAVRPKDEAALLAELHAALLRQAAADAGADGTVGAVLDASLSSKKVQQAFLARYLKRTGSIAELWTEVEKDPAFSKAAVADLKLTVALANLTGHLVPVMQALKAVRQKGQLTSFTDLAALTHVRWRQLLQTAARGGTLTLPPDVPGATEADRTENYIAGIRREIETMLPGPCLRLALQAAPETAAPVKRLLKNVATLDLYHDDLDAALAEAGDAAWQGIAKASRETVAEEARALQRLVRLTPHPDHVRILHHAGYRSAFAISRTPRAQFEKAFDAAAQALWSSLDGAYTVQAPASTTGGAA